MNVRFYNAGNKIDEMFPFSLPDGGDIHFVGSWNLYAPKQSWFVVPTEIEIQNTTIAVQFVRDVQQRFGSRGIVMLNPQYDASTEDAEVEPDKYPVAATEDAVIAKANVIWKLWLRKIVQGHLDDCQNAMAAGGAPRAASGFTKHAMKALDIQDPGEQYFLNLQNKNGSTAGVSDDVKAILASQGQMMQAMMGVVMALATGKPVDPEAIKTAMEATKTPTTLTSGIATGTITKPLGDKLTGLEEHYPQTTKGKASRQADAAKALATS